MFISPSSGSSPALESSFTCRSYAILSSTRSLSVPGFQREETAQRDVSRRKCEGVGWAGFVPFF